MSARWLAGVVAGIVLGLGAVLAIEGTTDDASAQANFAVTPEQLRINQRISQAAVRRSNESLNLLDPVRKSGAQDDAPGWGATQIRDSAITAAKLAGGAVTEPSLATGAVTEAKLAAAVANRLPLWGATDGAIPPALLRGQGVTAFQRINPGNYRATFNRDISQCTWSAIPALDAGLGLPPAFEARVALQDATTLIVRTSAADGSPTDSGFHVQVFC